MFDSLSQLVTAISGGDQSIFYIFKFWRFWITLGVLTGVVTRFVAHLRYVATGSIADGLVADAQRQAAEREQAQQAQQMQFTFRKM